ncbi:MAG: peptidoglycan-binding protein [Acidobacteriia bacterium]|nr:peptidoglycan-binding protein [Terriglobia bacterium]
MKKVTGDKAAWHLELEKLKREKPAEYGEMRTMSTLLAQVVLAELGYGTGPFDGFLDEKTRNALREYENTRRLPITGDPLSFETIQRLEADQEALHYYSIKLPSLEISTSQWDSGYVSAAGTWIISGEETGEPEQTSRLVCEHPLGTCTEATAVVSGTGDDRLLSLHVDTYEIERWDGVEITTKPLQFGCARYVRRFNRLQKSVTGIRSTTSNEGACKALDLTEKHLVLTDGFKVYWELREQRLKRQRDLLRISSPLLTLPESKER